MDVIVRTIVKGLFPFIIIFGVYILLHGHLTPGGSFPGGVIIASGVALIAISFGLSKAERLIKEETSHIIEGLVALLLVLIVLFESFTRYTLMPTGRLFEIWSAPQVLLLNLTGGVMVSMALILIVFLIMKE
jgi:multisubunit Na+/H+ antiporter MnhB subunit